jgi:hypothetical protein|nr:MAG TPA: hypothetical protein [Caudoviricetes sp.]
MTGRTRIAPPRAADDSEIIPIRLIDFDADLIAEYLAPACPDSRKPGENATI